MKKAEIQVVLTCDAAVDAWPKIQHHGVRRSGKSDLTCIHCGTKWTIPPGRTWTNYPNWRDRCSASAERADRILSAGASLDDLSLDEKKAVFAELSLADQSALFAGFSLDGSLPAGAHLAIASAALLDAASSLDDDGIWETTEGFRKEEFRALIQGFRKKIESYSDSLETARQDD